MEGRTRKDEGEGWREGGGRGGGRIKGRGGGRVASSKGWSEDSSSMCV